MSRSLGDKTILTCTLSVPRHATPRCCGSSNQHSSLHVHAVTGTADVECFDRCQRQWHHRLVIGHDLVIIRNVGPDAALSFRSPTRLAFLLSLDSAVSDCARGHCSMNPSYSSSDADLCIVRNGLFHVGTRSRSDCSTLWFRAPEIVCHRIVTLQVAVDSNSIVRAR